MRSRHFQKRAPHKSESRFSTTSLLLLGLIVGLVGALYYAWIVDPIIYSEASPARLKDSYKEEYILLVSQSYAVDGDWNKARQRLAALDETDLSEVVQAQLETYLREGEEADVVRNLAILADKLGAQGAAVAVFVPTRPTSTPTAVPNITLPPTPTSTTTPTRPPTRTPLPTGTPTTEPTATVPPIFRLLSQQRLCEADEPGPRLEVVVVDAFLEPAPGIEVVVEWLNGSDRFFTGFKPAYGLGYGDFTMNPDISYSVYLPAGSPTISGLRLESCDDSSELVGWRLTFQNTQVPQATPTPTGTP